MTEEVRCPYCDKRIELQMSIEPSIPLDVLLVRCMDCGWRGKHSECPVISGLDSPAQFVVCPKCRNGRVGVDFRAMREA